MTSAIKVQSHNYPVRIQIFDSGGKSDEQLLKPEDGERQFYCTTTRELRITDLEYDLTEAKRPMDFGDAIRALKAGQRVAREGWNGKGMWVVLMPRLQLPPFNTQDTARKVNDRTAKWIGEDTPLDCNPYLAMWTADGKWQPGWLASQTDMLAEDWVVVP